MFAVREKDFLSLEFQTEFYEIDKTQTHDFYRANLNVHGRASSGASIRMKAATKFKSDEVPSRCWVA